MTSKVQDINRKMDGRREALWNKALAQVVLEKMVKNFTRFTKKEIVELLPLKKRVRTAKIQLNGLQLLFENKTRTNKDGDLTSIDRGKHSLVH